jgi:hypothetical protein
MNKQTNELEQYVKNASMMGERDFIRVASILLDRAVRAETTVKRLSGSMLTKPRK